MDQLAWYAYPAVFAASGLLSLLLVPVALKIAVRRQIMDAPGGYKQQDSPVPYLGGVAIVASFALVLMGAALLRPPVSGLGELATILGLAVALGVVGLVDDLRNLSPLIRLVAVVIAGVVLVVTNDGVVLFDAGGIIDATVTVLWVAGITNAFNLLDNMDGLSAGVATTAGLSLTLIAALNGQFLVASLAAALAGCAVGFLRHNFHPARIYMGDAGSLFIGFVLAVLAMKLRFDGPQAITAFVPIVVLGLPILDTTLVVIARLSHGLNPLSGGRDHLSHRLVFLGLAVPTAVRSLYVLTLLLGWAGLLMSRLELGSAYLLLGLVTVCLAIIGLLMARVPVYSSSQRRKIMLVEVAKHERDYGHEPRSPLEPQSVGVGSGRSAS